MRITTLCLYSITFGTLQATPTARIAPLFTRLGIISACSYYLYDQHYHAGKKVRKAIDSAQETIISTLQEHLDTLQGHVIKNQKETLKLLEKQHSNIVRELKKVHAHNTLLLQQNRNLQRDIHNLIAPTKRSQEKQDSTTPLQTQEPDDKDRTSQEPAYLFFLLN